MRKIMENKTNVLMRLRRIEGQLRGLQRMVREEVPCSEILTQAAAVTAAMKRVATSVIQSHMEECLEQVGKKAGIKQREIFSEFQKAVSRYIDWA